MVDSDRGITNLHSPNDIIIDASMPVVVRDKGGTRLFSSVSWRAASDLGIGIL